MRARRRVLPTGSGQPASPARNPPRAERTRRARRSGRPRPPCRALGARAAGRSRQKATRCRSGAALPPPPPSPPTWQAGESGGGAGWAAGSCRATGPAARPPLWARSRSPPVRLPPLLPPPAHSLVQPADRETFAAEDKFTILNRHEAVGQGRVWPAPVRGRRASAAAAAAACASPGTVAAAPAAPSSLQQLRWGCGRRSRGHCRALGLSGSECWRAGSLLSPVWSPWQALGRMPAPAAGPGRQLQGAPWLQERTPARRRLRLSCSATAAAAAHCQR